MEDEKKIRMVQADILELNKKNSKHDIVHKGKTLKLELETCPDGIIVQYMYETQIMPEEIANHLRIPNKAWKPVLDNHIHSKWYDKLFGITLQSRVQKEVDRMKKKIQGSLDRQTDVKNIFENLK